MNAAQEVSEEEPAETGPALPVWIWAGAALVPPLIFTLALRSSARSAEEAKREAAFLPGR
jgi:hypothetical protein